MACCSADVKFEHGNAIGKTVMADGGWLIGFEQGTLFRLPLMPGADSVRMRGQIDAGSLFF